MKQLMHSNDHIDFNICESYRLVHLNVYQKIYAKYSCFITILMFSFDLKFCFGYISCDKIMQQWEETDELNATVMIVLSLLKNDKKNKLKILKKHENDVQEKVIHVTWYDHTTIIHTKLIML